MFCPKNARKKTGDTKVSVGGKWGKIVFNESFAAKNWKVISRRFTMGVQNNSPTQKWF